MAKPPESFLYDRDGKVQDPEIAHQMAEVESGYHQKIFGVFRPSQERIKTGEKKAERVGSDLQDKKNIEMEKRLISQEAEGLTMTETEGGTYKIEGSVRGHNLTLEFTHGTILSDMGSWDAFQNVFSSVDGMELSQEDAQRLIERYFKVLNPIFNTKKHQEYKIRQSELKRNASEVMDDILKDTYTGLP